MLLEDPANERETKAAGESKAQTKPLTGPASPAAPGSSLAAALYELDAHDAVLGQFTVNQIDDLLLDALAPAVA